MIVAPTVVFIFDRFTSTQVLRSYQLVLGSLPSPEAWVDDHTRKGYSAAALGGLVSTAVAGLQCLDPTARFVPCDTEPRQSTGSSSPPHSSNSNTPAVRSKRVREICYRNPEELITYFCSTETSRPEMSEL